MAAFEADEVPVERKGLPWIWIAAVGILAIAAVGVFGYRAGWFSSGKANSAATALQLSIESQENGLISLRWNPASLPVTQAREGHLRIAEEQKPPRTVAMNPAQLSAGHLFYESSSDRIEFDLEVVDKSGATVHESVVAGQKPEPAPVQTAASQPAQAAPVTAAQTAPSPNDKQPDTQKPVQPAPRAFRPPTLPKGSVEEGRLTLMEPAPALSGGSSAPIGGMLPGKVDIIPPPPSANAPAAPAPSERVVVGGKLQSAMLMKKVAPVYPALAKSMRIQGTVRFGAVVGKNGQVRDLKFVSGPRVLEQAAADAVRKWVYRPTMLDGRPVEVSTQIDITFTLD